MVTTVTPKKISTEEIRNGRYKSAEFAVPLWQIPGEFSRPDNDWGAVASTLMWSGSSAIVRAAPKAGVDRDAALLHVGAVLLAIDMTVEHKEASAAYLLSEWFEEVSTATITASHRRKNRFDATEDANQPGLLG